jgi:hypothetical protein
MTESEKIAVVDFSFNTQALEREEKIHAASLVSRSRLRIPKTPLPDGILPINSFKDAGTSPTCEHAAGQFATGCCMHVYPVGSVMEISA